ncbi:MAG: hypothetical protein M1497_13620 [Nitrospirae bacterium]|nr:hypothetical protein [Nitrospirota bacterium]
MSLHGKLEKLVRIVPGIAGYQDRAAAGDTDKAVRLKLASELEQIKRDLEKVKTSLMDRNDLSLLPALERVASKLDKTGNLIKYASRGYSGVFDTFRFDQPKLERLYSFDLELLDDVAVLKSRTREMRRLRDEMPALKGSAEKIGKEVDALEKKFLGRQAVVTEG